MNIRKPARDKMFSYTCFLVIIVLVYTVTGQTAGSDVSLNELFGYAVENNPEIKALRYVVETKKHDIALATGLPDPALSGGYFISPVETRVGPQQGKIGISQMIPWPGKLLDKKRITELEFSAAMENLNDATAVLLSEITDAYAALYVIGRSISINSESLSLLKHMESVLLARYSTAESSQMSVLKLQVEMSVLEDEISSLKADEVKLRAKLSSLLGGSSTRRSALPRHLPTIPVSINTHDLDSALSTLSPKMKKLSFLKAAASGRVHLSQKSYLPDFMLMTDYIFTGESGSSMVAGDENGKDPWVVGVSITLPVWINAKNAAVNKMKSMEAIASEKEQNTGNILRAQIIDLHESYKDAERKTELFKTNLIPRAKQSLALYEEAYANKNVSVLDFLDAQRTLLDLEIKLARQSAMSVRLAGKIDMIFGGRELMKLVNK